MSAWIIAGSVYVAVALAIVVLWSYGSADEHDREWVFCALTALLWPLLLVAGVLV